MLATVLSCYLSISKTASCQLFSTNLFQKVCGEWRFWHQSFAQGLARNAVECKNS